MSEYALDWYVKVLLPTWLTSAGKFAAAEEFRGWGNLPEDGDYRALNKVITTVRSELRQERVAAKRAVKHMAWDAWPAWESAWMVAWICGWTPVNDQLRQIRANIAHGEANLLSNVAHAARACAWRVAWYAAVDDAGVGDVGLVARDAVEPILVKLEIMNELTLAAK